MRRNISSKSPVSWLALSILLAPAIGQLPPAPAAAQSANGPIIYLDQAWSEADREWYYHFSQGSAVMSYDISLNLEVAGSQELFRSDANSERFGLIPEAANPQYNPDLNLGLSRPIRAHTRAGPMTAARRRLLAAWAAST